MAYNSEDVPCCQNEISGVLGVVSNEGDHATFL